MGLYISRSMALLVVLLWAATAAAQPPPPPRPIPLPEVPAVDPTPPPDPTQFGMGWGVGYGFSSQLVGQPLVEPGDAGLVDGRTVIFESSNAQARFLAESHYTFRLGDTVGFGPAMWVQPGGSLFDAAGGGLILELGEADSDWSFNILGGVLLDFSVSHLHASTPEGRRPPSGEILYVSGKELQLFLGFAVGR